MGRNVNEIDVIGEWDSIYSVKSVGGGIVVSLVAFGGGILVVISYTGGGVVS